MQTNTELASQTNKYPLSIKCHFEKDIEDVSHEHDSINSCTYPIKMVSYARGDFTYQWWTSLFIIHKSLFSEEAKQDGAAVLEHILKLFPNLDALQAYCQKHEETRSGEYSYFFYTESEKYNYELVLKPMKGNYNLYLYQYVKRI